MPANQAPIFSAVGKIGFAVVSISNGTRDLSTGTIYLLFTAHATNGSRVEKLVIQPRGTGAATVFRLFINNGGTPTDAANNILYKEFSIPATTASETAALSTIEIPLDLVLPPGYRLYATIGTAVAAGLGVTVVGGDY
jgi:hypothetical protein